MQHVATNPRCCCRIDRWLWVAAIATVVGCGPSGPTYWPITGKVTFRGEPVSVAQLRLSNSDAGIDVIVPLDADGRFTIITGDKKGLPEGEYHVAVVPKLDFSKMQTEPNGRPIPSTMPTFEERHPKNIPDQYHNPMTSGLTLTVKPEPNVFDVEMK